MKSLLIAGLLLGGPAAWAQAVAVAPGSPIAYRYCALIVDDRYFASPGVLSIHYGRLSRKDPADEVLEEAATKIRKAGDVIFGLNYLSNLGWECFSVVNVPSEASASRYVTSETRYLFRHPK